VVILVVSNVAKRQPHENNLNSSMKQGGSARRDTLQRATNVFRPDQGGDRADASVRLKSGARCDEGVPRASAYHSKCKARSIAPISRDEAPKPERDSSFPPCFPPLA
ncbi:hypothetical protein, partial [Sinorhizobium meliloti]|uniref:hypothetical protein n=1 Tax=Rhizobium meliloti TaxID=382 RepID=UPI001AECB720